MEENILKTKEEAVIKMCHKAFITFCERGDAYNACSLIEDETFDVNRKDPIAGCPPIVIAVAKGHKELADKLITTRSDLDINAQDAVGYTSLMYASLHNNIDMVDLLIKHPDLNVNLKNNAGQTAYDLTDNENIKLKINKLNNAVVCEVFELNNTKQVTL